MWVWAVRTALHEARFGPAIPETEYQKAVHTLHWRLRNANTGTPRHPREESYKLDTLLDTSETLNILAISLLCVW